MSALNQARGARVAGVLLGITLSSAIAIFILLAGTLAIKLSLDRLNVPPDITMGSVGAVSLLVILAYAVAVVRILFKVTNVRDAAFYGLYAVPGLNLHLNKRISRQSTVAGSDNRHRR